MRHVPKEERKRRQELNEYVFEIEYEDEADYSSDVRYGKEKQCGTNSWF